MRKNLKSINSKFSPQLFQTLAQGQRAGLSIEATLKLCGEISPAVAAASRAAWRRICSGANLADAGSRAGLWSGCGLAAIRAAESAGELGAIFQRLADYHRQQQAGVRQLRRGLIQPLMLLLALAILAPLPALASGDLTGKQYVVGRLLLCASLLAVVMVFKYLPVVLRRWPVTAGAFDRLQVVLPLIGPWYFRRQLCEFLNQLGLLLTVGIPAQQAVTIATPRDNAEVTGRINAMAEALEGGAGFGPALSAIEGINPVAVDMVETGEAAGKLDEMVARYSETETRETRRQQQQLTTWAPRVLYLIVAVWVGWQMVAGAVNP